VNHLSFLSLIAYATLPIHEHRKSRRVWSFSWQQTLLEAPIVVYQLEDLAKTS